MKKELQAVIGTFEGECADANITNNNGLDITRPVWEAVFDSEEYKQAVELGHYIGYLGHPEDPGCMDYRNACIVMTECHIDDNGKVYGKFNLVDTPVGRVVKSFIDAGVTFGISVRGAGDIINNSVEPGTFVFRGFDLVTFPAYPESIPEFHEIAASSDVEKQAMYKKICASVETELPNIDSCEALGIIQEQFPEQSETYSDLDNRIAQLNKSVDWDGNEVESAVNPDPEFLQAQLNGVMNLYLEEKAKREDLEAQLAECGKAQSEYEIACSKRIHKIERICASQQKLLNDKVKSVEAANTQLESRNTIVVTANTKLKAQLNAEKEKVVEASTKLENLSSAANVAKQRVSRVDEENLQYRAKIQASEELLAEKDETIRELQEKLDKTVVEANTAVTRASNLEGKVDELQSQITASQDLIAEYQDAYANYYSQAVGVSLDNVTVTASTSVKELQDAITGSHASFARSNVFVEPQQVDFDEDDYESELITL